MSVLRKEELSLIESSWHLYSIGVLGGRLSTVLSVSLLC